LVLETLISIRDAVRHPLWVSIIGGIISIICLAISLLVFETYIGLFTTMLITMAITPFMLSLIKYEEAREVEFIEQFRSMNFLERHGDVLKIYSAFFLGVIVTFSIAYILLPDNLSQKAFHDQINEINRIRGKVAFVDTFFGILGNNIGVLLVSFIFSFLFGAGAVFILTWNASVLAAAIGSLAKNIGGLKSIPLAALPFLPHGIFEILAYFIGGIAGGLVSAAMMRRTSGHFWFIVKDSLYLMTASMVLLLIGGIIETVALSI